MRQIVERHQSCVYRLSYRLVGDIETARDITQETFLKAFENLGCISHGCALNQWLRQIAINLIRDRWKARKKEVPFDEKDLGLPRSTFNPDRDMEVREIGEHIQAALMALPHTYREVFLLRYVEEMTHEEISETLEISVSAARVTAHRARKMLRDLLAGYETQGEVA